MNGKGNIGAFVSGVRDLPTLPSVVLKVNEALTNNTATIDSVSETIGRDASLTSKVLRLANSSYYGFSYRVDTLARAVTVLGFNTIRSLATTVSVFEIFGAGRTASFDMEGLWRHSLGCATAARALVQGKDPALCEKAFVCGLIHDMGKIVIAQNLPDETSRILGRLDDGDPADLAEIEEEILGFTHFDVGALIAEKWHFPTEFSEAIRRHHHIGVGEEGEGATAGEEADRVLACAVYAGNRAAKELGLGKSRNMRALEVGPSVWETLGLSRDLLPPIFDKIREDYAAALNSWELG